MLKGIDKVNMNRCFPWRDSFEQEGIDIERRYESIIATLCENLDSLDEPDARAAMIWIVGEYAERIDNADELLESFLDGFHDESTQVQLTLLTAIVKLFLKKPTDTQELVQQVLSLATQCYGPDQTLAKYFKKVAQTLTSTYFKGKCEVPVPDAVRL
eukprot:g41566.t1